MTIKILNLYAGIGGNRKLWTGDIEVTAVESVPEIAEIYKSLFPQDKIIVGDAHQYLIEYYKEFDFIWSSPPCQSHSRTLFWNHIKKRYPNMELYEEILFLKHFFKGKWVVENVKPYYEPLIKPQIIDRHVFWSNFNITNFKAGEKVRNNKGDTTDIKQQHRGFNIQDWKQFKGDKRTLLNNCVYPELGLHIFKEAFRNGK